MAAHPSISDPDRQETERLSNVMNRNVLVRNVILSAMGPTRKGSGIGDGTERSKRTERAHNLDRIALEQFISCTLPDPKKQ